MTTAYMPRHGSESRYRGARSGSWDPCRCTKCCLENSRVNLQRDLARRAGTPPTYPAEPLVAHIQTLVEAGMSYELIGRRAKVSHSTVSYLMRGLTRTCLRAKALRILAVTPGEFDTSSERPANGTVRRIRALYIVGHNPKTIAAASGVGASTISHIAYGHQPTVHGSTAAAIAAAYRILVAREGTSASVRARAKNRGWHGPLAWDADIDDPAAQPDLGDSDPLPAGPVILQPCGTTAAYRRHQRRGEPICAACRDANRVAGAERKHVRKQVAA